MVSPQRAKVSEEFTTATPSISTLTYILGTYYVITVRIEPVARTQKREKIIYVGSQPDSIS